jgi:hypothetical protein
MPNEPLAPHLILAGLPDEADYDAAYAAVMATERGRRFLSEYAGRNRNTDTTMVVAAIARVEAAIRGGAAPQLGAPGGDLVEIAAALDRLRAEIAAGEARTADISGAIERIQDIAFVLHERPVEQTLCDGLDAAIREIAGALAADSTMQGGSGMAQLVAALADRVRAMIAPASPQSPVIESTDASAVIADDAANQLEAGSDPAMPRPEQLFDFAEGEGEAFADAVTSLAASLPQAPTAAEQAIVTEAEIATVVEITTEVTAEVEGTAKIENESHDGRFDMAADEDRTAPVPAALARGEEDDGVSAPESFDDTGAANPADEGAAGASPPGDALSSEDILNRALSTSGHFVRVEPFGGARSAPQSTGSAAADEGVALPSASGVAVPSAPDLPASAATAQEDGDELFDPMPTPTPVAVPPLALDGDAAAASPPMPSPATEAVATPRPAAPLPTAQAAQPMTEAATRTITPASPTVAAPTSQPSMPPVAAMPMPRTAPRPPASDPLAAVRALSEEEVIALFS